MPSSEAVNIHDSFTIVHLQARIPDYPVRVSSAQEAAHTGVKMMRLTRKPNTFTAYTATRDGTILSDTAIVKNGLVTLADAVAFVDDYCGKHVASPTMQALGVIGPDGAYTYHKRLAHVDD